MHQDQGLQAGQLYISSAMCEGRDTLNVRGDGVFAGELGSGKITFRTPVTLAQSIDTRIAHLTDQIEELKRAKQRAAAGNLLDMPIDELRRLLLG